MVEHPGLRVTEYMVRLIASELTDIELNNVLLVGRVEGNPKRMQIYPKVAALFTQEDGTRMHEYVLQILSKIHRERFPNLPRA